MEGEANLGTAKLLASHEKKFHIYVFKRWAGAGEPRRAGRTLAFFYLKSHWGSSETSLSFSFGSPTCPHILTYSHMLQRYFSSIGG